MPAAITAAIDGHHRAEDQAENHRVGRPHPLQEVGHRVHQEPHRRPDHVDHEQADDQGREQRDDEDRLQSFEIRRQLDRVAQKLRNVAGQKSRDDSPEETRLQLIREQAADEAGR
jgi:hypothetical protein